LIGSLRGRLLHKQPPHLQVEVGGVGYELDAPLSTFYVLPAVGAEVKLLTHLVVREDAHVLYGFAAENERALFRSLLKVSGVGPRIALGILSGVSVEAFVQCVTMQDAASLTRIPGVGRKTAERLLIEMRDRLGAGSLGDATRGLASLANGAASAEGEAFGAMVALGYKPAEAMRLIKAVKSEGLSTEELIRNALQGAVRP
jgi:Holliday junction DNA helicase RuvA